MLLSRCPSRSFTVVGDRAQARAGFAPPGADQGIETWEQRLGRVGMGRISMASLSINYRTPEEVMAEAEPVIRTVLPDANVPTSVRRSHIPVEYRTTAERDSILEGWLADNHDGIACVIGDPTFAATARNSISAPGIVQRPRVRPGRAGRSRAFGDGDPGKWSRRSLCRDDPGDPATGDPSDPPPASRSVALRRCSSATNSAAM